MVSNVDILYVANSPKTGMGKYDSILMAAGISKAAEMGLPAPRAVVLAQEEERTEQGRYEVHFADSALMKIIAARGKLKKDADKAGLWADFDIDGDTGNSLRHEVAGLESNGPLNGGVRKRYSFRVNGYYSRGDSLFRNIDSLSRKENLERVEEAVGKDKAGIVYSMIDAFSEYSPERNRKIIGWRGVEMLAFMRENAAQTNTEKIFGLNDDPLYTDLRSMMHVEYGKREEAIANSKSAKLAGSRCRLLKWIGSSLVESKKEKLMEWKKTKEKQILALETRFAYKDAKEFVVSEMDRKIPVRDI